MTSEIKNPPRVIAPDLVSLDLQAGPMQPGDIVIFELDRRNFLAFSILSVGDGGVSFTAISLGAGELTPLSPDIQAWRMRQALRDTPSHREVFFGTESNFVSRNDPFGALVLRPRVPGRSLGWHLENAESIPPFVSIHFKTPTEAMALAWDCVETARRMARDGGGALAPVGESLVELANELADLPIPDGFVDRSIGGPGLRLYAKGGGDSVLLSESAEAGDCVEWLCRNGDRLIQALRAGAASSSPDPNLSSWLVAFVDSQRDPENAALGQRAADLAMALSQREAEAAHGLCDLLSRQDGPLVAEDPLLGSRVVPEALAGIGPAPPAPPAPSDPEPPTHRSAPFLATIPAILLTLGMVFWPTELPPRHVIPLFVTVLIALRLSPLPLRGDRRLVSCAIAALIVTVINTLKC